MSQKYVVYSSIKQDISVPSQQVVDGVIRMGVHKGMEIPPVVVHGTYSASSLSNLNNDVLQSVTLIDEVQKEVLESSGVFSSMMKDGFFVIDKCGDSANRDKLCNKNIDIDRSESTLRTPQQMEDESKWRRDRGKSSEYVEVDPSMMNESLAAEVTANESKDVKMSAIAQAKKNKKAHNQAKKEHN